VIALKRIRPDEENPLATSKDDLVWTLTSLAKFEHDLAKTKREYERFKA